MAEIIVTTTPVNLNVSTTQSNITVTDVETNVTVNVASLSSNITVSSEPVNVVIAPSIGVSNSEVRAALGNTNPILYDVNSGVFSFDADAAFNNAKVIGAIQSGNVTLKQVQETYFNLGNTSTTTLSINIANGTIQRTLLQSNVNQINFANLSPGGGVTVFLEQDAFGFRLLDTSTNFNNWLFVDDFKTLSVGAGNVDSLSVIYDGTTYYASLTRLNSADIDATFDNITVNYNTISNVLTANTVTVTNGLTSTANSNFVGAVTLGNNLNVAGQLFADGNQIYIGQPSTATNKIITAYSSATAGQIYYGGADSTWYFRNNTAGGATFKIPTSTTDLTEGANLYFSTSRANSAIQDYKGTISTTGSITTTANIQGNFFIGNGSLLSGITSTSNAQLVSYIATVPLTVGGNLTVNGNINATGNINVQNVEDLYVRDQTIVMNANAASPANVQIVSNRPGFANTEIKWNEQSDVWTFTNNGTTYYLMPTSTTDLIEGANLYYTTARANSAIGAYQGNINTAGTLTAGATEINGNLTIDPSTGNAIITGQSTTDDLSMYFENIDLRIGSAFDEGRLFVRDNVGSNVLMSISAAEVDNYTTRLRGDVIIGVDPNTSNTFGQFVFDVAQGDLNVAGGVQAENLFGNTTISSLNGDIYTTSGDIYTTSGNVSGAYIKGNGSQLTGLTTTQVSEGTNLYFTDARVRGNVSATTATGISYDSGTGVFSLASIPNSSLSNSAITINGTAVALGGTRTLTTSDIAEGTNLYFTTDRANNNSNAWLTTKTTTDLVEGANLYYTTDRANTAIGAYQGNISTTGNITAGNVITTNIHTNGTSLTLNSNSNVVLKETIKGVSTNVGNISGDGYGFFSSPALGAGVFFVQNVNAGNLDSYYFTTGNTTANSNIVTGVSLALISSGAANVSANINLVTPYYAIGPFGRAVQDPFPVGTYVTSVDAANSTITLNNPAAVARDLSVSFTGGGDTFPRTALVPGAFDANTGFLVGLVSQFTAGAGASRSTIAGQFFARQGNYGYPVTGPAPTDFVYAIGNSTNYSQGNIPAVNFAARTNFEGPRTVLAAPRGLVVGNADLTGRAENDSGATFGINILWDGLTSNVNYGGGNPNTQILLKQYSDNSFASTSPINGGPRILFTAARGNKSNSYLSTYPRNNDEMGRLTWWGPTQFLPGASSVHPPAWISGVAGQDFVDTNSGMGMYFANSPNITTLDKTLYLASTKGATLIASAADSSNIQQSIIFAPSHILPQGANNGNSVFLYNQTVSGTETAIDSFAPSGAHFAQINYANTTGLTGAKVSVTNGNNFATVHEGNIALSLDRNSNSANVRVAARSGAVNYLGSSNPDRVRFDFAAEDLANATPVTISAFTNATVAGALNGNVFFVKGPFINGSFREYELYTDSGLTTGVNLGVTNVNAGPGIFTYTRTNSVTAKDWSFVLAQGSNNLVLAEDGVTRTTFSNGTVTATAFVGDSITSASSNLSFTTNDQISINTRQRNGALTNSANIIGEGFALAQGSNFYNAPFMSYNGTGELKTVAFDGTTTAGSNVITGVANVRDLQGNPLTTGNILPQYAFCDYPVYPVSTIFPAGTYVVSVSGSNVYMSANALLSETLAYDGGNPYNSLGSLAPAMRDSTTGLQIILESQFDDGGANAKLITYNFMVDNNLRYGYSNGGPVTTDFTYAIGTASDYAIDTNVMNPFLVGRTNFSADKTVGNFRRGLTVGDADLTLRAENDGYQTFGLNVLWDGTVDPNTEYGSDAVIPQMLIKQYTDGTNQAFGGEGLTSGGPRLLFIGANGNKTDQPLSTYARTNQEIGRITWLSSTSQAVSPSSVAPPAFISVVSNKDQTGSSPSDFGMYLVASANPNNNNRTLWAGQHKANTIISAGSRGGTTSGDIYFAPARESATGNAVLLAERITNSTLASPHWAKIGYDNPTSNTGAKVSVTNGFNTAAGRNGNISLVLDRNDNGAGFGNKEWAFKLRSGQTDLVLTEDDVIRTTFESGGNVSMNGNLTITGRHTYDRVYGEFFSNVDQTAANTTSAFAITLNNTGISSDTSIVDNSNITIAKAGIYNIQFSVQLSNSHNAEEDFDIWLRKNGTNVPNTNTQFTVARDRSGNPGKSVAALNLLVDAAAGDVYQLMWAVTNTLVTIEAIPEQTTPYARPATPSVIVTVTPVGA